MKHNLLLLAASLSLLSATCGYKILCIFPVPSRSHNSLGKGIVDSLLKAGHEITWATPYDQKPANNLKFIDVSATRALIEGVDMTTRKHDTNFARNMGRNISTIVINTKEIRDALVNTQFDAVVTEWFFSDTDAGYAAIQQVPWILLGGTSMHPYHEYLVDEVRSLSTLPFTMNNYDFPIPMNFWQRVVNVVTFGMMWSGIWLGLPATTAWYEQNFSPLASARGVPLPPFQEALSNISIFFVNTHPSITPAQSLPPNVINIGGYHIDDARAPLPKDIQDLLDSSTQGVVYFSMGSVLKSSALPEHTRNDLIKILGEIPYTVLWKFEEDIKALPKNVHIRSWWPQASILAHPNVKVFITHGGLLSTLEAVHYGVPLLAVPVFADQPTNADRAVRNGFAQKVTYSPDMGPQLKVALKEMLDNDSYYKRAKFLSKIFNARPEPPSKLISFYVELAIESKGAYHLRSKTHLYAWYQRWMVDQLLALLATLALLCLTVRALLRRLLGRGGRTKVKQN